MPFCIPSVDDLVPESQLQSLERHLEDYEFKIRFTETGKVESIGDGIAWLSGLPSAAIDEVLQFQDGSVGLVFHLGRDRIGTILLEQTEQLRSGTSVYLTGQRLAIGVGDPLIGRIINPLGVALDGKQAPDTNITREIDGVSAPIISRGFVDRPMNTGIKIIDAMVPIGRGQRQLIIGDNGLGKSALALDIVLKQKNQDVLCVYVLIGQKRSDTLSIIDQLDRSGALSYTTVMVAEGSDIPGLKYLAPFAACTVAEYWMWAGRDTLVVYDDLSNHARAYRELSLLLRRPPGREAYPGDIFFLHSRLLERSTCLSAACGGGSMTALPIVETEQGEIASYIPTNLISITDGQFYLDRPLFSNGFFPALDITRSVSRIGGKAQHPRIKSEAGRMKLDFLQFLELETFTRFGTKLEVSMEEKIRRGQILRDLLKQEREFTCFPEFQLAWMIAFNHNRFDRVEPKFIPEMMKILHEHLKITSLSLTDSHENWLELIDFLFSDKGKFS
jgi:F-type H+-transporting ATPase subunit alpha